MNADKRIRLGIIAASAVLHAALLFFVIFSTQAKTAEVEEATLVSLVNISEYKEEAPAPKVTVKPPPPPVKEKPPELIPVQEEIAEILIETEEEPVFTETAVEFVETDKKPVVSGGGEAANKAAVSLYLQSNYNYIQRRIMNELIYPSQARRTGVQGVVEVSFVINMDGSISDTAIRKSSGNKHLDDEALRAVKSASPFRKPVTQVKIAIPVSFKLT